MVFGQHALYLRFPSQFADATIHRIADSNVHLDVLMGKHKPFLSNWKRGLASQPPLYPEDVAQEQTMIEKAMSDAAQHGSTAAYVKYVDKDLGQKPMRPGQRDADHENSPFGFMGLGMD